MLTFIGFVAVFLIILYKRSNEIVVVNPLGGRRADAPGSGGGEPAVNAPESLDFGRLLSTIQEVAQEASKQRSGGARIRSSDKGLAAIQLLVRNNQFIEAMQLYRRLYGVDLKTAKQAVDKMMLEQ